MIWRNPDCICNKRRQPIGYNTDCECYSSPTPCESCHMSAICSGAPAWQSIRHAGCINPECRCPCHPHIDVSQEAVNAAASQLEAIQRDLESRVAEHSVTS